MKQHGCRLRCGLRLPTIRGCAHSLKCLYKYDWFANGEMRHPCTLGLKVSAGVAHWEAGRSEKGAVLRYSLFKPPKAPIDAPFDLINACRLSAREIQN